MRCPNCGSEKTQFATHTSSRGFSFSNACCGSVILGPLGLLCGACGSGRSTEEFWICQECGEKFTSSEAKRLVEHEQKAKQASEESYINNKRVKEKAVWEYGDIAQINKAAELAKERLFQAQKDYDAGLNKFLEETENAKIKRLHKKTEGGSDKFYNVLVFFLIAGVLLLIFGLAPLGFICLGIALIMFLKELWDTGINQIRVQSYFEESSPENKKLKDNVKNAEEEYKRLNEIQAAIDACNRYEQNKEKEV